LNIIPTTKLKGFDMKKVVIAGMVSNALEWFDFAVYAQFATIIGVHFFPESLDPHTRGILTFAIFAAGFVVRPLGAIFFGGIGDRLGRRYALMLGILTMAVPTAAIGLLPSYASIGIAAPILLTVMRLIQGFSLGGEFSGTITYIVEHAPPSKRGIAGSASFVSMCAGMLIGSATAMLLSYYLTQEALYDWGWRVPFIGGLFIGLIGLYIRMSLSESPLYQEAKESKALSSQPLREILTTYWPELFLAMSIYVSVTAPFYTATAFVQSFMNDMGYTSFQSALANAIILVVMIIVFPLSAALSDRVGRKPILVYGTIALMIFTYPSFRILEQMDVPMSMAAMACFAAVIAFYMGPVPAVLVELFPTRVRFTGVALSYNLSAAVFGGTAPMVGMTLVK
jgi:MHS family proline/betaine transporter-like MFS transporter